uniref:Zinc finger protein 706 n=1 Tax=Paramormyrops kingsleyae TaxID=1676925 RepID=A0A3B3TB62_9TELE
YRQCSSTQLQGSEPVSYVTRGWEGAPGASDRAEEELPPTFPLGEVEVIGPTGRRAETCAAARRRRQKAPRPLASGSLVVVGSRSLLWSDFDYENKRKKILLRLINRSAYCKPTVAMARGHQKIQSQQKNAKKQAEAKKSKGHDQKAAAKVALVYTCAVCRTQMPDPKTFKQHFESKHPKSPLPPELVGVEA